MATTFTQLNQDDSTESQSQPIIIRKHEAGCEQICQLSEERFWIQPPAGSSDARKGFVERTTAGAVWYRNGSNITLNGKLVDQAWLDQGDAFEFAGQKLEIVDLGEVQPAKPNVHANPLVKKSLRVQLENALQARNIARRRLRNLISKFRDHKMTHLKLEEKFNTLQAHHESIERLDAVVEELQARVESLTSSLTRRDEETPEPAAAPQAVQFSPLPSAETVCDFKPLGELVDTAPKDDELAPNEDVETEELEASQLEPQADPFVEEPSQHLEPTDTEFTAPPAAEQETLPAAEQETELSEPVETTEFSKAFFGTEEEQTTEEQTTDSTSLDVPSALSEQPSDGENWTETTIEESTTEETMTKEMQDESFMSETTSWKDQGSFKPMSSFEDECTDELGPAATEETQQDAFTEISQQQTEPNTQLDDPQKDELDLATTGLQLNEPTIEDEAEPAPDAGNAALDDLLDRLNNSISGELDPTMAGNDDEKFSADPQQDFANSFEAATKFAEKYDCSEDEPTPADLTSSDPASASTAPDEMRQALEWAKQFSEENKLQDPVDSLAESVDDNGGWQSAMKSPFDGAAEHLDNPQEFSPEKQEGREEFPTIEPGDEQSEPSAVAQDWAEQFPSAKNSDDDQVEGTPVDFDTKVEQQDPPADSENESVAEVLARMQEKGDLNWDGPESSTEEPNHFESAGDQEPLEPAGTLEAPRPAVTENESTGEPSVQEYMSQLMDRLNGGQPQSIEVTPISAQEESPLQTKKTPVTEQESEISLHPENPLKPDEFVPQQAVPEKQNLLNNLRQVANQSTRSAVNKSIKKKNTDLAKFYLAGGGIGIALAGICIAISERLFDSQMLLAAAFVVATVFCCVKYLTSRSVATVINKEPREDGEPTAEESQIDDQNPSQTTVVENLDPASIATEEPVVPEVPTAEPVMGQTVIPENELPEQGASNPAAVPQSLDPMNPAIADMPISAAAQSILDQIAEQELAEAKNQNP